MRRCKEWEMAKGMSKKERKLREEIAELEVYPGPEVAVIALLPPHLAPMAAQIELISSSICINAPPAFGISSESISIISVEGVMGYPA